MLSRLFLWTAFTASFLFLAAVTVFAQTTLLNVSYDVSRELYKDVNSAFVRYWQDKTGSTLEIRQSHGGSSKQALAVLNGLEADVLTMNQAPDIDLLAEHGMVDKDWRQKFPHDAAPYSTISVFLVRKVNPKNIKDWNDLIRPGIEVVVPNAKLSGNGRYSYLAAWGYAKLTLGSDEAARDFVRKLFAGVPVFDGGGRGATTTFTQRNVGDVLVTFENEARLVATELGADRFDIVYPSVSINAAAPVAINETVVGKRNTRELAEGYLNFLYSPEGQAIIAKHNLHPSDETVLKVNQVKFPPIKTFDAETLIGPWAEIRKTHFNDGGIYDQITVK